MYLCLLPKAHMRPPLLSGPGHYRHSLDPGASCIHCAEPGAPWHSQGEKLARGQGAQPVPGVCPWGAGSSSSPLSVVI